jgi:hypothetical protein
MDDLIVFVLVFFGAGLFLFFKYPEFFKQVQQNVRNAKGFTPIPDRYKTLAEVQTALRTAGLESSSLIIGIDFTGSNEWTGQRTFNGRCLHDLDSQLDPVNPKSLAGLNPYQVCFIIVFTGDT